MKDKTKTKIRRFGFTTGYNQLQINEVKEATAELYEALGIKNRESFRMYRTGARQCKEKHIEGIEKVFLKYRITNVWDD